MTMPPSHPPIDDPFGIHVFQVAVALYVVPALTERGLTYPAHVSRAQVLFPPNAARPIVRINEEVTIIGQVKLKPGIAKSVADAISFDEIEHYVSVAPPPNETSVEYVTLFLHGNDWVVAYGLNHDPGKVRKHLAAATEFFEVAAYAASRGYDGVCAYNLFCAVELAAKATFLILPGLESKLDGHAGIQHTFNRLTTFSRGTDRWGEYVKTLNRLKQTRKRARYLTEAIRSEDGEVANHLAVVREFLAELQRRFGSI